MREYSLHLSKKKLPAPHPPQKQNKTHKTKHDEATLITAIGADSVLLWEQSDRPLQAELPVSDIGAFTAATEWEHSWLGDLWQQPEKPSCLKSLPGEEDSPFGIPPWGSPLDSVYSS